ncbi:MAG: hypothetical protein COY81_04090 [Candidatus Pacebacteria bacterium CG_4_10_14_0_8_um_filter_43_12]|nr:MAG: hypothetical protein COU66_02700 [Candidatus Pacebacteria bacterium CG10_big_fil_rev_8_21_14_0_10_44_11]PIY79162.1 MAG: hypothetical protein COY81_04090 [Candidatus Pacebacteria bacterium CG_4_10_14_0_8_um_filter_43_12]
MKNVSERRLAPSPNLIELPPHPKQIIANLLSVTQILSETFFITFVESIYALNRLSFYHSFTNLLSTLFI